MRKRGIVTAGLALGAVLGAGLAGCAGGPGNPEGEWAGTLRTEQGRCPDTMPSRLLVGSEHVSFVPGGGTLVLKGTRHAADDRLHAQLKLETPDHKPLPMVFEGRQSADGTRIEGSYGTPSCRAAVTLLRPEDHPFRRLMGG